MTGEVGEDAQADLDFDSGFAAPPVKPASTPEPAKIEPEKVQEAAPVKVEEKPAPKIRKITEAEYDVLSAAAAKTVDLEKSISKLFGTTGDMQQIVKRLTAETPKGEAVELPADVVAEMEADFPELAGHVKKALEKALKGRTGTGTATPSDPDELKKLVASEHIRIALEDLEDAHPTWREIVGVVDSEGKYDPNNEYRVWLSKQDQAYQALINSTNSAAVTARSIDKFLTSKKPAAKPEPSPREASRRDRIEGALQPRGDGQRPPPQPAPDAFDEGFRTG